MEQAAIGDEERIFGAAVDNALKRPEIKQRPKDLVSDEELDKYLRGAGKRDELLEAVTGQRQDWQHAADGTGTARAVMPPDGKAARRTGSQIVGGVFVWL